MGFPDLRVRPRKPMRKPSAFRFNYRFGLMDMAYTLKAHGHSSVTVFGYPLSPKTLRRLSIWLDNAADWLSEQSSIAHCENAKRVKRKS